jgi:hypothetical protein
LSFCFPAMKWKNKNKNNLKLYLVCGRSTHEGTVVIPMGQFGVERWKGGKNEK